MARERLQAVLKKTLNNLDQFAKSNDTIRRGFSGIESHTLDFHPQTVFNATLEATAKKKLTGDQINEIRTAAQEFSRGLKAAWGTKDFSYTLESTKTKKGALNVFRSMTGSAVYKSALLTYNTKVNQILNEEGQTYVDAGHSEGYGIAESALAYALNTDLHSTLDIVQKFSEQNEIALFLKKIPQPFLKKGEAFEIKLEIEAKGKNRGTGKKLNSLGVPEKGFIKELKRELTAILEKEDWGDMQGSPSVRQEIKQALIDTAKTGKVKKRGSVSRAKVSKKTESTNTTFRDRTPVNIQTNERDWSSLTAIINSKLEQAVKKNMGEPGLVNRTGTFAASAQVIGMTETASGLPSFLMSYDKTPYGVFDRRIGSAPWATPERDPYTLIDRSIRDILREEAIGRFYTRRS